MAGRIEVRLVEKTEAVDGKPTNATWDAVERVIEIEAGLPERTRWEMYFHEWAHSVWQDSGLAHFFTGHPEAEEMFCDAIASARIVEMEG